MSKTKRLVHQLNNKEYNTLHSYLVKSEAKKSADLLKHFRLNKLNDEEIKLNLEVNSNAYYTLRSRLNEKIESHILHVMTSPRTTILKQVAGINEILFTKSRTIALASFKKLEKELRDYDLSNELTLVYRAVKKLMIHHPHYYKYSQLYNKHISYMIAVDKVEDNLADYFKRYSNHRLEYLKDEDFSFEVITDEINSISANYESHRLSVYESLNKIFHQLFIEDFNPSNKSLIYEIEKQFIWVEDIFKSYKLDVTYQNLFWVIKYLKILFFYQQDKSHKGISKLLDDLKENQDTLITNYGLFTFTGYYYNIKLDHYKKEERLEEIYLENKYGFDDLELNADDKINYSLYYAYLAIGCYHSNHFEEGMIFLQKVMDKVNLANYIQFQIDLKLLECLFFYKLGMTKDLQQTTNNIRRHIRLQGKNDNPYANELLRLFNSTLSQIDIVKKQKKITNYTTTFNNEPRPLHSPIYSLYLKPEDFDVVSNEQLH